MGYNDFFQPQRMATPMSCHVLVLQHPQLKQRDLSTIQHLLAPHPMWAFDNTVLRIEVAADFVLSAFIQASLWAQHIDVALLPDLAFDDIGMIVSDMDSTLITIECVDEIAAAVGLKEQVSAITERAMRAELDFEQSLRQRVALLQGVPSHELQRVYDDVLQLSAGAEYLLSHCRQHGVQFMLVSGGFTYFTERLRQDLSLDCAYANTLVTDNGILTGQLRGRIIDAQAKADLLNAYRTKLSGNQTRVLAMGDGANDILMLQAADIGIAYHAKPKTEAAADAVIRFGGLDAVRKWFRE